MRENVPQFTEPAAWPPNSPDLNPIDYAVWRALQQKVYQQHVSSMHALKEKIQRSWDELSQDFVNRAIEQWRQRLRSVVKCNSGHIEQLFN